MSAFSWARVFLSNLGLLGSGLWSCNGNCTMFTVVEVLFLSEAEQS